MRATRAQFARRKRFLTKPFVGVQRYTTWRGVTVWQFMRATPDGRVWIHRWAYHPDDRP